MDKEKKRILVAEDEDSVRETAISIIENWGYEAVPAEDGRQVMDIIREEKLDLLLLDVVMPMISGFVLCELIKGNPDTARIPVILLTGLDKDVFVDKGKQNGADIYMTKPVDWDVLKEHIEGFLGSV